MVDVGDAGRDDAGDVSMVDLCPELHRPSTAKSCVDGDGGCDDSGCDDGGCGGGRCAGDSDVATVGVVASGRALGPPPPCVRVASPLRSERPPITAMATAKAKATGERSTQ